MDRIRSQAARQSARKAGSVQLLGIVDGRRGPGRHQRPHLCKCAGIGPRSHRRLVERLLMERRGAGACSERSLAKAPVADMAPERALRSSAMAR